VFNASVALGVPVSEISQCADSVNFCLSKGLRSPIGSLLCGSAALIERARLWRKRLGGGMRQAGILAACGLVSLNKMVDRLAEDHARARRLASAIAGLPGFHVDLSSVETNMVLVGSDEPAVTVLARLEEQGLLCLPVGPNRLRLVFHGDVDDEQTGAAIRAFEALAREPVTASRL
jgi:threonine aldolase